MPARDLALAALTLYLCSVSAPFDLDELVLAIAEKFSEHKMLAHFEHLRAYYRSRKKRKRERMRAKELEWDEDSVLAWAALWRIPPLENVYPQLPRPHCPCAKSSEANSYTMTTFPEGTLMRCLACETTWLVLHRKRMSEERLCSGANGSLNLAGNLNSSLCSGRPAGKLRRVRGP